ncbi:DNA-binding transcriptional LysR family regulator [Pelomonas saccharophila]|uniref:DNA-binding transcriptional LysR family regulator n=1 Tax=Roseateles saccharophilus TaxID=304 RepID=A0ABU1YK23_ROSSA|nr:LysR family transcriptional regulator [Roseateles saccharophilus]MDR7269204.1 DNA-binding transcriptional LysR family regulator [Roseateles saccharophilus]
MTVLRMSPNLDLNALRVFLQVAELAHFSRAADELGLPKGRVSQVVRGLEAQLGTRLFLRTTRRVSLTSDGELLAERARSLLADAGEIEALFQQDQQLGGRLRVDLPVRLALDVVLPALPTFLAEHPGLQVELSCTDRRVDLVEEGFDCVLRVGAVHDPMLVAKPVGQLAMMNVASPAYLARRGTPATPEDLVTQGHELVHYSQTWADRRPRFDWVDAEGRTRSLSLPARVAVNHTDAYEVAALNGMGIAQAPCVGMRTAVADGRLVRLLQGYEPAPMPVQLVMSQRRHTPRRVRVFMDWLTGLLAGHLEEAD